MGSVKIGLDRNTRIQWPHSCAVCNNPHSDFAKTSITNTTKFRYYIVAMSFTHQTHSLSYPVCKKHKILCNMADKPAKNSLLSNTFAFFILVFVLWLIVSLLLSVTLDFIGFKNIGRDMIESWSGYLSVGLVILLLICLAIYKPVRILSLSEDSMELFIRNDKYLNEFKALNMEHIVK